MTMDCDNVSLVRSRILRKRSTRCASLPSMSRIRTDTTRSPSPRATTGVMITIIVFLRSQKCFSGGRWLEVCGDGAWQVKHTEFAQTHKPQHFEEVKTKDEPTLLQDPPLDFQLCLCGWNLWHHPCCTQVLFFSSLCLSRQTSVINSIFQQ